MYLPRRMNRFRQSLYGEKSENAKSEIRSDENDFFGLYYFRGRDEDARSSANHRSCAYEHHHGQRRVVPHERAVHLRVKNV